MMSRNMKGQTSSIETKDVQFQSMKDQSPSVKMEHSYKSHKQGELQSKSSNHTSKLSGNMEAQSSSVKMEHSYKSHKQGEPQSKSSNHTSKPSGSMEGQSWSVKMEHAYKSHKQGEPQSKSSNHTIKASMNANHKEETNKGGNGWMLEGFLEGVLNATNHVVKVFTGGFSGVLENWF